MKILFFIENLGAGGKERRLVELIKGLSKSKEIEMELVLTKENIHYEDIHQANIKVHYIVRKYLKKDPRLFFKFFRIAKKFNPDIIHVWGSMVAIYAIPTKLLLNKPMVNNQITNAPEPNTVSIFEHKIPLFFSEKILANSYAGLNSYNANNEKSDVIYNGFDFDRVAKLEEKNLIRKKFNISTEFVVGMVASFTDKKDYATYIGAANTILETRTDVTFLCIGAGNDEKYRAMVSSQNKDKIHFLGKQEKVESIMNICDIGVLSTYAEGISNALLEFMALSKPVIANNTGGTPELIADTKNGFLIYKRSPSEYVTKINYLLENSSKRDTFGQESKKIVQEKFSISKMIDEFKMVYKNTVEI